jgi:hypothetical protein
MTSPARSKPTALGDDSPPGSWRAAMQPDSTCAACRQTECAHPDAIYQGTVPPPGERADTLQHNRTTNRKD